MDARSGQDLRVSILSVGTEVTSGDIVDTNASELARSFTQRAARVVAHRAVPDDLDAIAQAFRTALAEADVVVASGGLGPTADDLTRDGLALAVGRPLVTDLDAVEAMKRHYERLSRRMPQENLRQARLPEGASLIANPNGTAPGIAFATAEGRRVFLLPGPPREMRPMATGVLDEVAPLGVAVRRTLRVSGVGESQIDEWLSDIMGDGNPSLRPYAKDLECHLQLVARAEAQGDALHRADALEAEVVRRLGPAVYGRGEETLERVAVRVLQEKGATVAFAESLTAGLISGRLASVEGASAVLAGAIVTYTDKAKTTLLGVDDRLLQTHGAVSAECAAAMALGARRALGADYAVSATGWAGPAHATQQPVGTVYYGIADAHGVVTAVRHHMGQRDDIRRHATQAALDLLRRRVLGLRVPAVGTADEAVRVADAAP